MKNIAICIFGGYNSIPLTDTFEKELEKIADSLSTQNVHIIYGGGNTGIMSVIPKIFFKKGGNVTAISTNEFDQEDLHSYYGKMELYNTLDERQSQMMKRSDLFLCLPGGIGTLSELFQALSLNYAKIRNTQIILFNYNNFYDLILEHLKKLPKYPDNLFSFENSEKVIHFINSFK